MDAHYQDFKVRKPEPLSGQIQNHVRELIVSGKLRPGERLPSTEKLAKTWATHVPTVHKALTRLVAEGVLERHQGKGTFVRQREEKLTCVGVFDTVAYKNSLYMQSLHGVLKEELATMGIEMDVWIDSRPEAQLGEPWSPLLAAARRREFQAAIILGTSRVMQPWQEKLPVPTVFQGADSVPQRVDFDLGQFAELSVCRLADQGCRSVGLIGPYPAWLTGPDGSRHRATELLERFTNVARDRGLTLKNEWVRLPSREGFDGEKPHERFGYEQFQQLWRQATRPEGLVVFPDSVARGVILGIRENQVPVPAGLKLVLHKHESIDLLCPMPAAYIVSSERAMAKALIQQAQRQFRGEACEPILISFQIKWNEETKQP